MTRLSRKGGETVRKKTATSVKPASAPTSSTSKATGASGRAGQMPSGKVVSTDAIRVRAYEKWEAAGRPDDDDARFWLDAERELSERQ